MSRSSANLYTTGNEARIQFDFFDHKNKIDLLYLLFSQDLEANEYTQDRYSTGKKKVRGTMGLLQTEIIFR